MRWFLIFSQNQHRCHLRRQISPAIGKLSSFPSLRRCASRTIWRISLYSSARKLIPSTCDAPSLSYYNTGDSELVLLPHRDGDIFLFRKSAQCRFSSLRSFAIALVVKGAKHNITVVSVLCRFDPNGAARSQSAAPYCHRRCGHRTPPWRVPVRPLRSFLGRHRPATDRYRQRRAAPTSSNRSVGSGFSVNAAVCNSMDRYSPKRCHPPDSA